MRSSPGVLPMGLTMHFFNHIPEALKPLVRHLWHIESPHSASVDKMLLPMDHVDLLLCDGGEFLYQMDTREIRLWGSHLHGLRSRSISLKAVPQGLTIGITFTPWGFQHFAGGKMSRFRDQIIPLDDISAEWIAAAAKAITAPCSTVDKQQKIVDILASAAQLTDFERQSLGEIAIFLEQYRDGNTAYTKLTSAQVKYYQRLFKQYIGIPPKEFFQLSRFQEASKSAIITEEAILDLVFTNNFYDQSHLIREFKKYTGVSPGKLQGEKPALKSHLEYD
jgi:hypothetical protein